MGAMGKMVPTARYRCVQQRHEGDGTYFAEYDVGRYVTLQKFTGFVACRLTYQQQHRGIKRAAELHKAEHIGNIQHIDGNIEDCQQQAVSPVAYLLANCRRSFFI